ncbi:MAG: family 10 glycosylhydrolase [Armatimonadetes bacterium]|nr:family 10 glycosylhydrolase [Armatimonadota bacterium]
MLLIALMLAQVVPAQAQTTLVEHRGVWLHPKQFADRATCDEYVARMARAGINICYPLVWYHGGRACWHTQTCAQDEIVTDDYDPLAYLVKKCHAAGIQVHAWFVNGALGAPEPVGPFAGHTDWLVEVSPGVHASWWDLGKPEVRAMEKQLMVEVVEKYPVDGVHFDYIRYDGSMLCFCDHCRGEFKQRYGLDIMTLSADKFPLAAAISANPLGKPTTARVLVSVDGGPPAIAVNTVGDGNVLLFNWQVYYRPPKAASKVLDDFLSSVGGGKNKPLLLYRPEETIAKYGTRTLGLVRSWLGQLGYKSAIIKTDRLDSLKPTDVLFLVAAYYTPEEVAAKLLKFVQAGGALVVVDGPVYGIKNPSLQKVLGFAGTAGYYNGFKSLVVETPSGLIPTGGKLLTPEEAERIGKAWAEYRKDGVSQLVKSVFEAVKALRPDAAVTAAVFATLRSADSVFQDWPRWIREGFIDYVLPMAYVMTDADLEERFKDWESVNPDLSQIIPGLSLYQRVHGKAEPRPPDLVLHQIELCRKHPYHGVNFFALAYLNDDLVKALSEGPFKQPARPYVPLLRPGG